MLLFQISGSRHPTYQCQKKSFIETDIIITKTEETATQTHEVNSEDETDYINDNMLHGYDSDMLFDFQDKEENAAKILKFLGVEHSELE